MMKQFNNREFIFISTLISALSGYFILHPIVNVTAEFFHIHEDGKLHLHWNDIGKAVVESFSYEHWPMAIAISVLTALIGYFFSKVLAGYRTISEQTQRFSQIGKGASTIIHDLKSSLTIINGMANFLKEELHDSEQIQYCDMILSNSKKIEQMAREIKLVAMDPEAIYLVKTGLNLATFIRQTVENTKLHSRVEMQLDESLTCNLDPAYFERVFWNLFRNADEALVRNQKPLIRVLTQKKNSTVLINIADNGPGIPIDIKKTLFTLGATSGKPGGTGIGLYSTKKIIEAHKGNIWFESYPDKGTTFYIKLPI
jgi:signal transduction histidine kinase